MRDFENTVDFYAIGGLYLSIHNALASSHRTYLCKDINQKMQNIAGTNAADPCNNHIPLPHHNMATIPSPTAPITPIPVTIGAAAFPLALNMLTPAVSVTGL
jgi:hypothetical protein